MRKATTLCLFLILCLSGTALAQQTEYVLSIPTSTDFKAPFTTGLHSGSRAVSGPFDMDGDGRAEVLFADYTGGGRVHVVENRGPNKWELVYSTPWLDSTATTSFNARYVYGTNANADLDGDGKGEIILPTGRSFSKTNPNADRYKQGLYIFEYTGKDDDYGSSPASILEVKDRIYVQANIAVRDVDGDGQQELLFPNNGAANVWDNWYVYSVSGDIGGGFEVWVEEASVAARPNRGGGSPWAMLPADLNGDTSVEMVLHSWNNYNFTIGKAIGLNTYNFPENQNLQAETVDAVAFAGGTVIDINGDGDDEVFFSNYFSASSPSPNQGSLTVINYEKGEDVMTVKPENVKLNVVPNFVAWGIDGGDFDGDGMKEIIAAGRAYSGTAYSKGESSVFLRIAEFIGGKGGDPENPANYLVQDVKTGMPVDSANFDVVFRDSLGTKTKYYATHNGETAFPFRIAYLGDADKDGANEVALSFQSIADSVYIYNEVWNATDQKFTRTIRERKAAPARPFLRIVSGSGFGVAREHEIVLPEDYQLSANYPNPFNPTTTFSFTLPLDKTVSVKIYDVAGRVVKTLVDNQHYAQGTYDVTWDATSDSGAAVASGTYLYALEYGNFRQTRAMVLIK